MWSWLLELTSVWLLFSIPEGQADRGDLEIPEDDYILPTTLNYWDYLDSLQDRTTKPTTQNQSTTLTTTTPTTLSPSTELRTTSATTLQPTIPASPTASTTSPTTVPTAVPTTVHTPITRAINTRPSSITRQPQTATTTTMSNKVRTTTITQPKSTTQDQRYVKHGNGSNIIVTMKTANESAAGLPPSLPTETPKPVKTNKDKSDDIMMLYIIAGCLAVVLIAIAAVITTLFWLHSKGKLGSAGFLAVPQSA